MECPYCGKIDSKVVDSRLAKDGITITRRRQCLACSDRFTTYESGEDRLLPVLIRQNAGGGATTPNVKTMLSIMSSTLTMLSEETEKLVDKAHRVEKTQAAKIINRHTQVAQEDIFEEGLALDEAVKDYEKTLILEALEKTNWVKAKAARLLHINRTTLVEKIKNKKLSVIYEHRSQAQQSI